MLFPCFSKWLIPGQQFQEVREFKSPEKRKVQSMKVERLGYGTNPHLDEAICSDISIFIYGGTVARGRNNPHF